MEHQEIDPNAEYLKGFNEGYALAQLMPGQVKKIIDVVSGNQERQEGMRAGVTQYTLEQDRTMQLDWDKDYEPDNAEPTKEKDVDKDDYGLEL